MGGVPERLTVALADRYRIERELGAGGMATVYLAADLKHDRKVAIKVLKPELAAVLGAERFAQEIRTTAALRHPHILPLFDSGQTGDGRSEFLFYVMPYVEGETLRDRLTREKLLPIDEALRITREVADALSHAHSRGLVHRDVKPENIMLEGGHALLADFGIARAVSVAGGTRLTETGLSVGTPQYMSPEQALGDEVIDARSDEYALACVLYEMLAGDPPFTASTAQALVSRKLTGTVASVREVRDTVAPDMDRVIVKALARVPADRYETVSAFAEALSASATGTSAGRTTRRITRRSVWIGTGVVAVAALAWVATQGPLRSMLSPAPRFARVGLLPLMNGTGDSTQDYLAGGISESVTSGLARLEHVDIISLAAAATSSDGAVAAARRLGLDAVVSGSVSRDRGRLRVALHLGSLGTEPSRDDTLERPIIEAADLEQDIVERLARAIGGRPAGPRRTVPSRAPNAEAHDLYLQGRYHLASRTPEGLQNALDYFRQALARDPASAAAYAGLAQYYSLLPFYTNTPGADAFAKAKTAALKAVELDDFLPEGHVALAYVLAYGDWDWDGAEREYGRALALQPGSAEVHHAFSRLLAARDRIPQAVAEAERAYALDPLSLVAHANIGIIAYFARDYVEARRRLEATLELDRDFSVAHWGLGMVLEQLGQYDEAIAEVQRAIAIDGSGPTRLSTLAHMFAEVGRRREAEAILKDLQGGGRTGPVQPYMVALVLAGLGQTDEAITQLEESYEERSAVLSYLDRDPRFDVLRSSPRFVELLRRMGFQPR